MIANSFTGTRSIGKLRLLLLAAMAAVIFFDAAAAWACPANYVACGERDQGSAEAARNCAKRVGDV